MLQRLEAIAICMARAFAVLGLIILLAYAVMTVADGLLRSLANSPIEAVRDLDGITIAVAVSCCFPLAFLQRSNITIRVLSLISPRAGQIFDAVASVIVAIIVIAMDRQLFVFARSQQRAGDSTVMLEVKTAPFWYAVAAIMLLAAATQIVVTASDAVKCFGRPTPPPASGPIE